MFNLDPRVLARLAPELERVMVLDAQPAAARLVTELLKGMGARQVVAPSELARALELVAHLDPQLICTEVSGPGFDGADLIGRLRRSDLPARRAPVIVISGEATVEGVTAVRDAGAHEFLRKPYTANDLLRRVDNVVRKPRPWVETAPYVGPDRRRFNSGAFPGDDRRASEPEGEAEAA